MLQSLFLTKVEPAAEDDVGVLHQPRFGGGQFRRRTGELAQLIHAVVYDAAIGEMAK